MSSPDDDDFNNPQKRREVRLAFRSLISDMAQSDVHEELTRPESKGVRERLEKIDDLYQKVRHSREAVLDSEALKIASKYAAEQVQKLQTHVVTFDPHIFAEKLVTMMSDRTGEEGQEPKFDWHKLGSQVSGMFKQTPKVTFMYGSLAIDQDAIARRKERIPKDKPQASAQQIMPQQVGKEQDAPEEATTKEVHRLDKVLQRVLEDNEGVVSYWDFVINPSSFTQTVENIFHLSFLIKDGRYKIVEEDDLPWIEHVKAEDESSVTDRKQAIISITVPLWQELVRIFEIKESLIPPRPEIGDGSQ